MNILTDLNLIIDRLVNKRADHLLAKRLFNFIEERQYTVWLSSSSIDNLQYILLSKAKKTEVDIKPLRVEFKRFIEKVKIFSVTGLSVREGLKTEDIEDHIIYTNFKRIAPDGVIISKDKGFKKYPDVIKPMEFLERYKNTNTHISSIPLLDLREEYRHMLEDIDEAILKNVAEARYIFGPQVKEFEEKISEYTGGKHCIGICSGTDALVLSLRALAIKLKKEEYWNRDDLIITTPFTFTATGDAILRAGATPLFVDIDPHTYNIDANEIRDALSSMPSASKVVGILPVHLYGHACNMDEIMKIAEEYRLFVLEDVAQAFGGTWKAKKLGSIGTAGIFSFFPSKNLGGFGDGGMVATNDDGIAELVRMLLRHGGKDKYNVDYIGYNARLDTLQAAILLAKLKYIDEFNERRRKIAEVYAKELAGIKGIVLPITHNLSPAIDSYHVYHQYTIRVLNGKRDELQKHLKDKGISTMVYYPVPLHKMEVFKGKSKVFGVLNESEKAVEEVLSLPIEPLYNDEIIQKVIESIKSFILPKT